MAKSAIDYFAKEKEDKVCQLLSLKWNVLKEIVYVLKIPLRATVSLQKQDLTLSDVYGIWMKMKIHLQACIDKGTFKSGLAQQLKKSLDDRKEHIFKNPFMSAAVFLDPRYRRFIMGDAAIVQEAKQTLIQLWQRLNANDEQATEVNTEIVTEQANDEFDFGFDEQANDGFDFGFDEQAALNELIFNQNESSVTRNVSQDIEFALDMFNPEPIASEKSILEYWASEEANHRDLHQLAMVVYSIPPTEVQNERDFSLLNFVFSDRRCALQAERLEDIMIININSEVFQEVKKEEIELHEKEKINL